MRWGQCYFSVHHALLIGVLCQWAYRCVGGKDCKLPPILKIHSVIDAHLMGLLRLSGVVFLCSINVNPTPCYNDTVDLICHYPDVMERVNGQLRYTATTHREFRDNSFCSLLRMCMYVRIYTWNGDLPILQQKEGGMGEEERCITRSWTWSCTGSDCVNGTFLVKLKVNYIICTRYVQCEVHGCMYMQWVSWLQILFNS